MRKCHAPPAQSLLHLGPRSWVFAPAFRKSKLKNVAVCPVRTAFGPLRCRMAFRGAGGTQEGSGCALGGAYFFLEGNTIAFLISRTALRGFFAILATHRRNFFSTFEGLLRPGALASIGLQRQRSQILTSASGDAIWGAHRPNYIHGQFGGIFFVPQVPPAPRCTPVVISTKLTSRLSLAPCCACQPSFGHIQAAPRRALAPVESSPGLVIWPVSGTPIQP